MFASHFSSVNKLKVKLNRLESEGVIEKVTGPTEWISPIVVVEKQAKNKNLKFESV